MLFNAACGFLLPRLACAADLRATALRVITRDTEAIGGPAIRHGRSFAKAEGIPVTVERAPFDRLYDEIMVGCITGRSAYDVVIVPSDWLGDLAPYLAPVPEWLVNSEPFRDILPAYRDVMMRWEGQWKAVTVDGDLQIGAYRSDLFADPVHQRTFAERYGQALVPPETWEDYRRIAEYFHGRSDSEGRTVAGTLEAFAPRGQRVWTLFSRAACYVNLPQRRGAMFFDPQTMSPMIDNPGWVRALSEYVAIRPFAPVDAETLDSYDVRARFVAGRAAMNIDWTDTGVLAADGRVSEIAGRVGFFMLPGCKEVWNQTKQEWKHLDSVRHVPFIAFGGWIAAVLAASPRIEAAWRYIAWFSSPQHSAEDVLDGTSGINPYRRSHLAQADTWRRVFGASDRASAYLRVLRSSLDSPDAAGDLRIPGFRAYAAAFDAAIGSALSGALPAQAALASAAAAWQRITDRLGRDGQRRHYRWAMELAE